MNKFLNNAIEDRVNDFTTVMSRLINSEVDSMRMFPPRRQMTIIAVMKVIVNRAYRDFSQK